MCRAHGIAHQAVRSIEELPRALESAWRLNRHSVVEVRFSPGGLAKHICHAVSFQVHSGHPGCQSCRAKVDAGASAILTGSNS